MNTLNHCLNEVDLKEKVTFFKKGINTPLLKVLDPDGVEMSIGESQKLAISRALYKNGDIMILDEPTAALDSISESKTYNNFNNMVKGKLAIYISHRLSSTKFCDKIIYLEFGKVIESGTHDDLIKIGGKYAEMYNIQASYYLEDVKEVSV